MKKCELVILKDDGDWTYRVETVEKSPGSKFGKHICNLNAYLVAKGELNPKVFAAAPELLEALEYTNMALKILENRVKELLGLPLELTAEDLDKTLFQSNRKLIAKITER